METNNNAVLLTIIAEESLASLIEEEIMTLGSKGFTSMHVSGRGLSGTRNNQWDGMNVRIESIVPETVCNNILSHLRARYFGQYAVIAFYHPVHTVRPDHFQ